MKKNNVVAIYTRVSTEDQSREGHSLDEQIDRIKKLCDYKEYEIYKIYTDAGISAKNTNRPQFQEMLKDLKAGKFSKIVIYKLDRLTRSIVDLEKICSIIESYNCSLDSVVEEINTANANGKFFIRMLTILAQLEIEQTSERTIMGLEGAIKKGHVVGRPPLGYKREEDKSIVIDEKEAKIVRRIFDLYLKGFTYHKISNIMKIEYENVRKWKDSLISKIINNKLYCGDIEHRKTLNKDIIVFEDVVPSIISKTAFYECQKITEINSMTYRRSNDYVFAQRLICDKCKMILTCSTNKGHTYYRCKECKTHYREDLIEKDIINKLTELVEFNLALTYNNVITDNETVSNIINDNLIENSNEKLSGKKEELRFMIDSVIIEEKRGNGVSWINLSFEEKRNLIFNFIDEIHIKKLNENEREYKIEITYIGFRNSKVEEFFNSINNKLIDPVFRKGNLIYSISVGKNEKEVNNYIDKLREKYDIKVNYIDVKFINKELLLNQDIFKIIRLPKKKAIEKEMIAILNI